MHWKSIVKTALLGTERSTLPSEVSEFLNQQGIDTQKDPAEVILEAAALLSQMNKAGFPLRKLESELPEAVGDADEKLTSAKSTHHLKLILDGTFEKALPEFILYLNLNKKQLPPSGLPDLLEQCKADSELWEKIRPAIGKRGQWLMALNPEWKVLIALPNSKAWETGQKEERIALLKYLRENEPDQSIELLESTWEKESVQSRIAFLKVLDIGLSKSDEYFLEDCLYDSRQEVREVAAHLLSKIPDSELVERMVWRVETYLKFQNGKIELELPDELDETAKRDGISHRMQSYKSGLKAGYLGQMLAKVPPEQLENYFGKSPSETLEIFAQSDWIGLLIQAVIEATVLHKDLNWTEAILNMWLENQDYPIWQVPAAQKLLENISDKSFNQFALKFLNKIKSLPAENTPVGKLLTLGKHDWDDQLTLLIIRRFQHWMSETTSFFWDNIYYKKLLQTAAYRANPTLYDAVKSGWNYSAPTFGQWEPEIDTFLRTLVFRKEMIGELEK